MRVGIIGYELFGYELVVGTSWSGYDLVLGTSWLGLARYELEWVRVDRHPLQNKNDYFKNFPPPCI